jgi:hypothetical protein
MYGCNVEDLRQFVESSISVAFAREPDKRDGIAMLLTSMLSDVQELILLEHADDARRTINRVKYILNEYLARAPQ